MALLQQVLELVEANAVPAVDAAGPQLFASPSTGMSRFVSDSTHGDSDTYDTGRAVLRNAANVVSSNTAFTSVFANKPVAAITYEIEANLLVSIGAAAAVSLILQLTGPAVGAETNVKWRASYEAGTGESVFAGHSIGSLASVTLPARGDVPGERGCACLAGGACGVHRDGECEPAG